MSEENKNNFARFINVSPSDTPTWKPLGIGIDEIISEETSKIPMEYKSEPFTISGNISNEVLETILKPNIDDMTIGFGIKSNKGEDFIYTGKAKVKCKFLIKHKKKGKRWIKRIKSCEVELIGYIGEDNDNNRNSN